ncbi:efflux RND transporter permease subunit [Sphingobacterium daejeonense]|uniref:efflux RND transporter permease subunit n=1 Tax=Sphingobacterium daejeonense TaxID=371142 RepID=UPI0021A6F52A|nr:efflux RND transporter permease subunit [Sphingobacterium daejeonense]MCT1532988.1 efflux RND transporter permease subunit [Sphingobacterium daejeonense]
MSLIRYPIKNYQFTLIMVLMIMVVAVSSIMTMPRAEDPDMKGVTFPVLVVHPGTSPKDMEQLVVKPLEARFYALDNIKKIETTINNSVAFFFVEFEYGQDYDNKYQELVRELNAGRSELPDNIYSMEVLKIDPTNVSVVQMALISESASESTMKKFADELKQDLEKIKALKEVEISGLPDQQIKIDLNQAKLAELGITMNRIIQSVQSENQNIPAGSVNAGSQSFSVKSSGNYQSIDDIKNTIIASSEGKNILLKDVATVYPAFGTNTHITRLNGFKSILINAAQKEGMNISDTQKEYLKVIDEFKAGLPENIDLVLNFDQAQNVNKRLGGLGIDFGIAILLVLITLLPLGTRASLVVMIAIPLSLGIGVIAMNYIGYSLNQLSIVGFVVALGLVVDDSIVVVENIERWMREGYSKFEAAIKGTEQIALAVLGCTVTLVIAFLPLVFMPEMAGEFIRSMPIAVISSVIGSMFIALLVVPFLSSKLLKPHEHEGGNAILRGMQRIIHKSYGVFLDKALKHPGRTVLIALAIFLGSLALIPAVGFSLFPPSEKPQFMIHINAALQSNIETTDSLTKAIEKELKQLPDVKYYTSNVGKGNPRVYYNMQQAREDVSYADIFVQLHDDVKSKEKIALIEDLRKKWTPYLGAKVEVRDFEQGVPIISPVEVKILGDNLDSLQSLSYRIEDILKRTEGTEYVNNPIKNNKTDIKVNINREKAMALGVPTSSIDQTIRVALSGYSVGTYSDPNSDDNDYDILVSVPKDGDATLATLEGVFVDNVAGTSIPLTQLANLEFEESPSNIYHQDKIRTVSVNSFVKKGYGNDEVINSVIEQMEEFQFPDGYYYEMGGEVESREMAFGGFGTIIMITVFMFIAVLILEFKTFKSTLIVLSVIPLGIVGAVLALLITGNTLSFVATIGIVALAGIEVKNTILLVDFTNQLRREGMGLNEAIEKAGEIRFLPIILTTLTAIGGLMPIAWSSNPLISPLAIVMIGGLISSTLLSRIVTPVVYKLIPPKIEDEKISEKA